MKKLMLVLVTLMLLTSFAMAAWQLPRDANSVSAQEALMYGGLYSIVTTTTAATTVVATGNTVVLVDLWVVTTSTPTTGTVNISDGAGANSITLTVGASVNKTRSIFPGTKSLRLINGLRIRPVGGGISAIPIYIKQ